MKIFNPLKFIIDPAIKIIDRTFAFMPHANIFLMILSLVLLFLSLTLLIKTIRNMMLQKIETIINRYLFRNDLLGFSLAILLTFIVQSSSVTTSLIIPLAGAGIISIRQIYPYTLGTNIGTTGTAIIAALATQNEIALTVAFAHLCFNIFGIMIFYPLKLIPIKLAEYVGQKASKSTKNLVLFIIIYILLHFIPIVILLFT